MIWRGAISCLLGHGTGLLFCIYLKFFRSSIFNSVDVWSSMSCFVVDIELADINFIKSWEFCWRKNSDVLISSSKKSTNPQNKIFRVQEFCTELCETEDVWKIVSFPNTLPRDVNGEYFAKRKENCTILGSFLDKEVENLDDHGCPKIRYLVDSWTHEKF